VGSKKGRRELRAKRAKGHTSDLVHKNPGRTMSNPRAEADVKRAAESLEACRKDHGAESEKTLKSILNLAFKHRRAEQFEEAERRYLEVLESRKRLLGPDHTDTLKVQGLLALLYEQRNDWHDRALEMYNLVIAERTKALGEYHKDTITTYRNLGNFLYKCSKHRQASETYAAYFQKVKTVKGVAHPDTWMALLCIFNARFLSKLPLNHKIKGAQYKRVILLLAGTVLWIILQHFAKEFLGIGKRKPSLL
jgi:tetratricopeptide (TPR) repeat protein